jgi:UDP-3-O-[3-hydroxymyristoyl] glucosamine N-acyltransferase
MTGTFKAEGMAAMAMKLSTLVEQLAQRGAVPTVSLGNDPTLQGLSPIEQAEPQTLSYIGSDQYAQHIATTVAAALILPLDPSLQSQATGRGLPWLATTMPRALLAQAISCFYQPFQPEPGIDPTATVHPTAQLGKDVAIAANVVIQAGVTLGDGVCIHPNVVIYPGVTIGDRTVLHANCVIHERSQIGPDCVIHSGAAIGAEGFGFVPIPEGWLKMPQSGHVVLEAGVEVGCNSAIDRPALGFTHIGTNTKIDNLVQIAHGAKIGPNCAIAAQAGMAGGVKLGQRVILAGQVGIADHLTIGDGAIASAKAGIINNVAAGETVAGYPAIPHKLWLKLAAIHKRLPEMYQHFRKATR